MSKSIELTQSQIKAYENGATVFMFPITNFIVSDKYQPEEYEVKKENGDFLDKHIGVVINKGSSNVRKKGDKVFGINLYDRTLWQPKPFPIQKGDKDIFIKEEDYDFYTEEECFMFGVNQPKNIIPASQMTKEQSRYSLSECIDVRIVSVQDITVNDMIRIDKMFKNPNYQAFFSRYYNNQMQEQNINRTYEQDVKDDRHICLAEFRR